MIVRVSEAAVRPEQRQEFMTRLAELVADFPSRYDGLLSHEILVDRRDDSKVIYLSRWTGEEALRAYAGEGWATDPVTFPDEDTYLSGPLELRHFDLR